ncbi:hypothetical protein M885DRAFT_539565 [Pelagophyceae sp. CCMP2097]|nr:hypothetical protein M885DRAFT_539565 [Pelagophyceae sp. CCMP2097]
MSAPSLRMSAARVGYRALYRLGSSFEHYNTRMYARRRIRLGFEQQRNAQGEALKAALDDATEALVSLRRQVTIANLYPSPPSVMEFTKVAQQH